MWILAVVLVGELLQELGANCARAQSVPGLLVAKFGAPLLRAFSACPRSRFFLDHHFYLEVFEFLARFYQLFELGLGCDWAGTVLAPAFGFAHDVVINHLQILPQQGLSDFVGGPTKLCSPAAV